MCKGLDWEKANKKDKVRKRCTLPPMKEVNGSDLAEIERWWRKLTKKQKRSLRHNKSHCR